MSCINPNDPKFKSLLARVGNPLLAELEFDKTFFQQTSSEGIIASEKTLRDLGARMSDRIGIPVKFISDRSQQFKGKLEDDFGRSIAVVNLAYATLDTPIHEILGHPIIRAIKNNIREITLDEHVEYHEYVTELVKKGKTVEEARKIADIKYPPIVNQLYLNLLKELKSGRGKEVLDRIKRDYNIKSVHPDIFNGKKITDEEYDNINAEEIIISESDYLDSKRVEKRVGNKVYRKSIGEDANKNSAEVYELDTYTLEEQQEEAIVELLGLYTAGRLNNVRDGKLISLLKRLLKEMKAFMREFLGQKEVEIDKLPDNMTLGDIADLLAYSNSKLILPGNEVIYTTPDNQRFKTYAEASKHISELAKSVEDVDLSNINNKNKYVDTIDPYRKKKIKSVIYDYGKDEVGVGLFGDSQEKITSKIVTITYEDGTTFEYNKSSFDIEDDPRYGPSFEEVSYYFDIYNSVESLLKDFIEKNKEYEQSKEIIEEWKKVNNIQYNPEEIYSRGQEFVSVVGAYSSFDVNLMMQNLLQHIEDNEKAGGKFAISAFTKPIDRQIGHLEGGGGKIKFKIYPQSNDILWAANTDVFSGSVWDASEKINKDKKSELLGISYTKYPSLRNVNTVQPNLASIVDDLAHHHNELGITLTGNNFRLEYDEDIPYTTKKIIDGINSILDQKYGKLVKPDISKINTIPDTFEYWQQDMNEDGGVDRFRIQVYKKNNKWFVEVFDTYGTSESIREVDYNHVKLEFKEALASNSTLTRDKGIQPTQTNETLKIKIQDIKIDLDGKQGDFVTIELASTMAGMPLENDGYMLNDYSGKYLPKELTEKLYNSYEEANSAWENYQKQNPNKNKEYTSQALINSKIAKLKEVAKKYPRSLITSEVKLSSVVRTYESEGLFDIDDLPFQKIPSTKTDVNTIISKEEEDNKMPPPCGI